MTTEKPSMRAHRLAQLLETIAPLPECLTGFSQKLEGLGRYAFIQRSTGDSNTHWFTICVSRQEVLDYWLTELDPYDWVPYAVVDLDTGMEVPFYVRMSFTQMVTHADEPAAGTQ